jgi:hypothetical protein
LTRHADEKERLMAQYGALWRTATDSGSWIFACVGKAPVAAVLPNGSRAVWRHTGGHIVIRIDIGAARIEGRAVSMVFEEVWTCLAHTVHRFPHERRSEMDASANLSREFVKARRSEFARGLPYGRR